ncbi:MAG: hypothetical protein ACI7YS_14750 [Flavobacterium sp.]
MFPCPRLSEVCNFGANCPQGMAIDQYKKKILNGELYLSSAAQTSILTYAAPLKTYGSQFASNKGSPKFATSEPTARRVWPLTSIKRKF